MTTVHAEVACPICGHAGAEEFLNAPDRFNRRPEVYRLLRCGTCSLIWLADPPDLDAMAQHYGTNYDKLISGNGDAGLQRWTDRRNTLDLYKKQGTILDIGCSSGGFLASLPRDAWQRFGVEFSERTAERAASRSGAQVFVGDVLDAPFSPSSFDVVTSFHVLEHMHQPGKVFEKVAGWLKPGGIFYVLVPNIDSAAARIFKSYWYSLELPRHLFHFSPASLGRIARAAGLNELSLTTHREPNIEYSAHYVVDDVLRHLGVNRKPLAEAPPTSFPRKVVRKLYRIGIRPFVAGAVSLAGDGESIHAVFQKPS